MALPKLGRIPFSPLFGITFADDLSKQEEAFHLPLFYILDGLHSDDVVLKRLAQGWMRCELGLYIR